MLIESLAGLVLVRRRTVALRFGGAMSKPLFGGVALGLAACGSLASDTQIDDLSHIRARLLPKARWSAAISSGQQSAPIVPIQWRDAASVQPCQNVGYPTISATHFRLND